jgi:polyisoprenyl-teichoic acid--peptidoglycan teichoic acid transferase
VADVDDPDSATPPKRTASRLRAWGIVGAALATILVIVVATAGFVAVRTVRSVSDIARVPDALPTGSRPPSAAANDPGASSPLNILLIGSDKRNPDENGRSDSFIVLHISADRKSASFVSFPRDMWVAIAGHGSAKINAAYSWGGSALAVQTIETLIGVRIDHVVTTDFGDFMNLIDVVGGISVDNPVAFTGIDSATQTFYAWPRGVVQLDGKTALAFSRQRYELPRGDLDRALRQRAVLKALALKIASPNVLANPVRLSTVIASLGKYVTVDSEFTDSEIFALATSMRITAGDQISMLQAPITGFGRSSDGQSIDVVDVIGIAALGAALKTDTVSQFAASRPK